MAKERLRLRLGRFHDAFSSSVSFLKGTSDTALCSQCAKLDLEDLLDGSRTPFLYEEIPLGSLGSISTRKRICVFCRAISEAFSPPKPNKDYDVGQCFIMPVLFCQCQNQTSSGRLSHFCNRHIELAVTLKREGPEISEINFRVYRGSMMDQRANDRYGSQLLEVNDRRYCGARATGTKVDYDLIRYWISACESNHDEDCNHSIWPGLPEQHTNFLVIDVELRCVVPAPPDCQFVALSYVWGKDIKALKRLTTANYKELCKPGGLLKSEIPGTIWDALDVTENIGQKYCWVDALCIVQDDPIQQGEQIFRMGEIYSRASLTIIAASGENASAGLPGVQNRPRSELSQEVIKVGSLQLLRARPWEKSPLFLNVKRGTWMTRGWTYQEALFSRRLLIFDDDVVFWSCRQAHWSENMILEVQEPNFEPEVIWFQLARLDNRLLMKEPAANDTEESIFQEDDSKQHKREQLWMQYSELLREYTRRALSDYSDSLNAFSGLTRALSLKYGDEFIWGLPRSHFAEALLWERYAVTQSNCSQTTVTPNGDICQLPLPSWSWAAWKSISDDGAYGVYSYPRRLLSCPIAIYSVLTDGSNYEIINARDYVLTSESSKLGPDWLHTPRELPKLSDSGTHSGRLKFWTSSACVYYVCKVSSRMQTSYKVLSLDGRALCVTQLATRDLYHIRDQLPQTAVLDHQIPFAVKNSAFIRGKKMSTKEIHCTIIEVIIIHRTEYLEHLRLNGKPSGKISYLANGKPGRKVSYLAGLIVTWEDGIAYREGPIEIREEDWISLKNREWKLVILG
ncbi:HET-domain-containing protein [Microthyrium microscopicum]|uniref:HET-domain-containing protein n=1 Tax=Microthyrium microscopicum TaxID=703497 RepID=A0A6A6UH43_9PEZI|nr:HET-domain-containing protein [Microthyrium microscopicum]